MMIRNGAAYEHGACIALLFIAGLLVASLVQLLKDKASFLPNDLNGRM